MSARQVVPKLGSSAAENEARVEKQESFSVRPSLSSPFSPPGRVGEAESRTGGKNFFFQQVFVASVAAQNGTFVLKPVH